MKQSYPKTSQVRKTTLMSTLDVFLPRPPTTTGNEKYNSDPIEAVFGRLKSICGGNDALDARAVTTALDHIVKESGLSTQLHAPDVDDAEKMAAHVPQKVLDQLICLKEQQSNISPSVTYSVLAYVGGYFVKLISEYGCDACVMLLSTTRKDNVLFELVKHQD
ncbi:hypothetical protein HPB49_024777 [Dermacentor silvarum]|uniref:Uncharacterized protein n=1 Tax=Dermacentor silvarum TaxID=543639 RepID=A0ACB8CIE6_DERSI|nr:hypothetical protein HPB49_024777 [Dermacentor silvarum]